MPDSVTIRENRRYRSTNKLRDIDNSPHANRGTGGTTTHTVGSENSILSNRIPFQERLEAGRQQTIENIITKTDEEESQRTKVSNDDSDDKTLLIAIQRQDNPLQNNLLFHVGFFINPPYWYHHNTTITNKQQQVVSHAIPPLSLKGGAA